jgi:hypothetical protein
MTDNLRIWNAVEKTNPAHTKKVNQRGGFTAISAAYQIMAATEQFGPIGIGWGYISGDPIFHDALVTVPVTLWHGDRANTFGPMMGCEEWKDKNGRVDSDAPKKATTDAITKLLSQLGFNADVFLGKFDDNKYVAQVTQEFAAKENPPPPLITDEQRDELADMMTAYGVSVQDFCKVGKIKSLKDLRAADFGQAKSWVMNQRKAA